MPKRITTLSGIAKALKVSLPAVSKLSRAPGFPRAVNGVYDMAAVRQFHRERAQLNKASPGGDFGRSMRRKMSAQAELAEIELAERRGQLVDAETVERNQRQFVSVVTSDLLNMPAPLALLVANKPPAACEVVIKDHVRRMIEAWRKLAQASAEGEE